MVNRYFRNGVWEKLMSMRKQGESVNDVLERLIALAEAPARTLDIESKLEEARRIYAEAELTKAMTLQLIRDNALKLQQGSLIQPQNFQPSTPTLPIPQPTLNQPQPKIQIGKFTGAVNGWLKLPDGRMMFRHENDRLTIYNRRGGTPFEPACAEICTMKDSAVTFANLAKQGVNLNDIAGHLGISSELANKHARCHIAKLLRNEVMDVDEIFPEIRELSAEEIKEQDKKAYPEAYNESES